MEPQVPSFAEASLGGTPFSQELRVFGNSKKHLRQGALGRVFGSAAGAVGSFGQLGSDLRSWLPAIRELLAFQCSVVV